MRRKKVESETDFIDAMPDLVENEQFVIEDTRKIRKEKTGPVEVTETDVALNADEPQFEKYEEPSYSETSLAALIYSSDEEPLASQYCTVVVRRNPDGMNDRFATPCSSVLHLPRLVNIELSADRADIEDRVRAEYGGGHYFFQIQYNNRLTASWKTTLADLPEYLRQIKQDADIPEPRALPPAEPVNPFDQFLDTLRRQKEMKDLLFGEDQKRMEAEITRLKDEAAKAPLAPEPRSEKLVLLEHALQASNTTLQDRLLTHLFPEPEENSSHWIVDLVKTGFEHKEELVGIAQMLLGSIAPAPPSQGIEAFLRQPAPGPSPENGGDKAEFPRSNFQRKPIVPTPEPETAITDSVIDHDIETAAIVIDVSNERAEESGS